MRVLEHGKRQPKEAVDTPVVDVLTTREETVLGSLLYSWSCFEQGTWPGQPLETSSCHNQPECSLRRIKSAVLCVGNPPTIQIMQMMKQLQSAWGKEKSSQVMCLGLIIYGDAWWSHYWVIHDLWVASSSSRLINYCDINNFDNYFFSTTEMCIFCWEKRWILTQANVL